MLTVDKHAGVYPSPHQYRTLLFHMHLRQEPKKEQDTAVVTPGWGWPAR